MAKCNQLTALPFQGLTFFIKRAVRYRHCYTVVGVRCIGQTAIFRCYATGDPRPSVQWSCGDWRPVMARDRVREYVDRDNSDVMELDDVRASDSGEYTVTAINEFGSCSASALLVVEMISRLASLQDMYV